MSIRWTNLIDLSSNHCFASTHSVGMGERADWILDSAAREFECRPEDFSLLESDDQMRTFLVLDSKAVVEIIDTYDRTYKNPTRRIQLDKDPQS